MTLGIVSVVLIAVWGVLTMTNILRNVRFFIFLFSHIAIYVCVFTNGIYNSNYLFAVVNIALVIAVEISSAYIRKKTFYEIKNSMTVAYFALSLILGLFILMFFYVLPNAISIVDLSH